MVKKFFMAITLCTFITMGYANTCPQPDSITCKSIGSCQDDSGTFTGSAVVTAGTCDVNNVFAVSLLTPTPSAGNCLYNGTDLQGGDCFITITLKSPS